MVKYNMTSPRFKVEGRRDSARVFLHCSICDARIREIAEEELVDCARGYYCKECDPGVVMVNQPDFEGEA